MSAHLTVPHLFEVWGTNNSSILVDDYHRLR
jgi:hypothetical protein